jgi:hypothetical protein
VTETAIQWSVVLLKFCAAGGAGILGFVGLSEFVGGRSSEGRQNSRQNSRKRTNTIALIVALALLVAGGCTAFIRLGKPAGIMSATRNIATGSPISLEFLAFVVCLIVAVAYLFTTLRESPANKALGIAAMIMAVAVGFTGGYSHQAMVGMTAWHSPTVSCSFLLSALVLGGFVYLLLATLGRDVNVEEVREVRATEGSAASEVSAATASEVTAGTVTPPNNPTRTMTAMTGALAVLSLLSAIALLANGLTVPLGDTTALYWVLVPLVGGIVPVACAVLAFLRPLPVWWYLGMAGAFVGAFVLRATIWLAVNAGLPKLVENLAIIVT